jgi:hypothetical protein
MLVAAMSAAIFSTTAALPAAASLVATGLPAHEVVGWYVGTNQSEYPLHSLFPSYTIAVLGTPLVDTKTGVASCDKTDAFTAEAVTHARANGGYVQWRSNFPSQGYPWVAAENRSKATTIREQYMATIGQAAAECGVDGVEFDTEVVGNGAAAKAGIVTPEHATEFTKLLQGVKQSLTAAGSRRPVVSCDIGAVGVTDGSYPLELFTPWVNVSMLNAGAFDFVNTMSYHEPIGGSIVHGAQCVCGCCLFFDAPCVAY